MRRKVMGQLFDGSPDRRMVEVTSSHICLGVSDREGVRVVVRPNADITDVMQ